MPAVNPSGTLESVRCHERQTGSKGDSLPGD
jgi:hypothetical protein